MKTPQMHFRGGRQAPLPDERCQLNGRRSRHGHVPSRRPVDLWPASPTAIQEAAIAPTQPRIITGAYKEI